MVFYFHVVDLNSLYELLNFKINVKELWFGYQREYKDKKNQILSMQEEREKEDEVLSMSMILKQSSEFKGYLFNYWYMYTHVILLQTQKKDREGGGVQKSWYYF